jgi:hypothetical protein
MTDNDPEDDDLYAYDSYEDDLDLDEPRPLWTRHRILLTIVVIIIVVTFLAYSLQGFFLPPPPPPTLVPGSLI